MARHRIDAGGEPEPEDSAADARAAAAARRERRLQTADPASSGAAAAVGSPVARGAGRAGGAAQFVRECWAELGRVQWPDRRSLWQATAVVIIACVIVGAYLAGLDAAFSRAAQWLIQQQAS